MPYRMLSDEERARIMEMHEGGIKCLDIEVVLNVLQLTISTLLTN